MEETLSPGSPHISFVCGDPQADPRVGDDYQAEVPPLTAESPGPEAINGVSEVFLVGLPVPVMWINDGDGKNGVDGRGIQDDTVDIHESLKSIKSKRNRSCGKNKAPSHEQVDIGLDNNKRSQSLNLEPNMAGKTEDYQLVPGSSSKSWQHAEVDSFLLGLYAFGKNFVHVKKFMEIKGMGEILSFYYGEFYESDKYRRWSNSRKKRRKKRVYGRKLFSGWRQQELLTRLIRRVPGELHKMSLLEVSKSFAEGNISLEKYIFTLKAVVGINALVDAVAIGKGKEDLTCLASEPVKTTQWFTISSDRPAGKAYASLTSTDIINQLTGGSRLSKARCNDIFWEAVWPRLLARGWHSEQPKDQGYVASKDYLVFLVPGVKKFSRRKLVKGDHYFDSVSDILTKVASEPQLLEFKDGEFTASSRNEQVPMQPSNSSDEEEAPSDRRRHHYLRSPVPNCNSAHMKFTVVDTSLAVGGKVCALKELRYAAMDSQFASKLTTHLKNDSSVLEDSVNKSKLEKAHSMPLDGEKSIKNADDSEGEPRRVDQDNPMRFTIVDTSLDHGGKSSRLRKRRYLPADFSPGINSPLTETCRNSSTTSLSEHEQREVSNHMNAGANESDKNFNTTKSMADTDGPRHMGLDSFTTKNASEKEQDQKTDMSKDRQSGRVIEHKFTRRAKGSGSVNSVPVLKRRKLSACVKTETSCLTENISVKTGLKQGRPLCPPQAAYARTNGHFEEGTREENGAVSNSFSSNDNPEERSADMKIGDSCGMEIAEVNKEKPRSQFSIDLNLTPDPQDMESVQHSAMETQYTNKLNSEEVRITNGVGFSEQQPDTNPRRQSTRKRPLTTRVLEALETGFFMAKKSKGSKPRKQARPFKNPATKAGGEVRVAQDHASDGSRISKHLNQIEEKHVPEERPPIMLKFTLKRN